MAMRREAFERLIAALLIAGAVLFVLLLAGVGSELMTNPTPYHPSPTQAAVP